MKLSGFVNSLAELEAATAREGLLVPIPAAALLLSVSDTRVRMLCLEGKLRCFSVFGLRHVAVNEIKVRLELKAAGKLKGGANLRRYSKPLRKVKEAWLVGLDEGGTS